MIRFLDTDGLLCFVVAVLGVFHLIVGLAVGVVRR